MKSFNKSFKKILSFHSFLQIAALILVIVLVFQGIKLSVDGQRVLSESQTARDRAMELRSNASQVELTDMVLTQTDLISLVSGINTGLEKGVVSLTETNQKNQKERKEIIAHMRELAIEGELLADRSETQAWRSSLLATAAITFGSVLLGALLGDSLNKYWSKTKNPRKKY